MSSFTRHTEVLRRQQGSSSTWNSSLEILMRQLWRNSQRKARREARIRLTCVILSTSSSKARYVVMAQLNAFGETSSLCLSDKELIIIGERRNCACIKKSWLSVGNRQACARAEMKILKRTITKLNCRYYVLIWFFPFLLLYYQYHQYRFCFPFFQARTVWWCPLILYKMSINYLQVKQIMVLYVCMLILLFCLTPNECVYACTDKGVGHHELQTTLFSCLLRHWR